MESKEGTPILCGTACGAYRDMAFTKEAESGKIAFSNAPETKQYP